MEVESQFGETRGLESVEVVFMVRLPREVYLGMTTPTAA